MQLHSGKLTWTIHHFHGIYHQKWRCSVVYVSLQHGIFYYCQFIESYNYTLIPSTSMDPASKFLYLPGGPPKGGENGLTNFHPKEQDNSDRARQGSSERICGSHVENSPRSFVFFFFSEASGLEGTLALDSW